MSSPNQTLVDDGRRPDGSQYSTLNHSESGCSLSFHSIESGINEKQVRETDKTPSELHTMASNNSRGCINHNRQQKIHPSSVLVRAHSFPNPLTGAVSPTLERIIDPLALQLNRNECVLNPSDVPMHSSSIGIIPKGYATSAPMLPEHNMQSVSNANVAQLCFGSNLEGYILGGRSPGGPNRANAMNSSLINRSFESKMSRIGNNSALFTSTQLNAQTWFLCHRMMNDGLEFPSQQRFQGMLKHVGPVNNLAYIPSPLYPSIEAERMKLIIPEAVRLRDRMSQIANHISVEHIPVVQNPEAQNPGDNFYVGELSAEEQKDSKQETMKKKTFEKNQPDQPDQPTFAQTASERINADNEHTKTAFDIQTSPSSRKENNRERIVKKRKQAGCGKGQGKRGKVLREHGRPKRPLSAYNIFFREERARILHSIAPPYYGEGASRCQLDNLSSEAIGFAGPQGVVSCTEHVAASKIKTSQPEESPRSLRFKYPHGKISFEKLAKKIGKRWQELDTNQRSRYRELARVDLQRFKSEMHTWKNRLHSASSTSG